MSSSRDAHTIPLKSHRKSTGQPKKRTWAAVDPGALWEDQVSHHLGMDRRTVHRHLVRDKETFSSIVDAVRVEQAPRYLEVGERPLADVAELLGFSGLSALSRWFSRRFGQSASTWRAAHARG